MSRHVEALKEQWQAIETSLGGRLHGGTECPPVLEIFQLAKAEAEGKQYPNAGQLRQHFSAPCLVCQHTYNSAFEAANQEARRSRTGAKPILSLLSEEAHQETGADVESVLSLFGDAEIEPTTGEAVESDAEVATMNSGQGVSREAITGASTHIGPMVVQPGPAATLPLPGGPHPGPPIRGRIARRLKQSVLQIAAAIAALVVIALMGLVYAKLSAISTEQKNTIRTLQTQLDSLQQERDSLQQERDNLIRSLKAAYELQNKADPEHVTISRPEDGTKVQRLVELNGQLNKEGWPVVLVLPDIRDGRWHVQDVVEHVGDSGAFTTRIHVGDKDTVADTVFRIVVVVAKNKEEAAQNYPPNRLLKALPPDLSVSRPVIVIREKDHP